MKKATKLTALVLLIVVMTSLLASCGASKITKVELVTAPKSAILATENLGTVALKFTVKDVANPVDVTLDLTGGLPATIKVNALTVNITYTGSGVDGANYKKVVGNYEIIATFKEGKEIGKITFNYRVVTDPIDANFALGAGTQADPYQITTAQELNNLRNMTENPGKYYKIMNDIDLASIANWIPIGEVTITSTGDDGKVEINPLKAFTGKIDGNNKSIKNLTINNPNNKAGSIGLFTYLGEGSEIKNLSFVNANITAMGNQGTFTAILAGSAFKTTLTNISVANDCTITGGYIASIVYDVGGTSTYTNCVSSATLNVQCNFRTIAGGLFGQLCGADERANTNITTRTPSIFTLTNCEFKGQMNIKALNAKSAYYRWFGQLFGCTSYTSGAPTGTGIDVVVNDFKANGKINVLEHTSLNSIENLLPVGTNGNLFIYVDTYDGIAVGKLFNSTTDNKASAGKLGRVHCNCKLIINGSVVA